MEPEALPFGEVGQIGDTRLMVMASLLVADELSPENLLADVSVPVGDRAFTNDYVIPKVLFLATNSLTDRLALTYNFGPSKLMRLVRFADGFVEDVQELGYGYRE